MPMPEAASLPRLARLAVAVALAASALPLVPTASAAGCGKLIVWCQDACIDDDFGGDCAKSDRLLPCVTLSLTLQRPGDEAWHRDVTPPEVQCGSSQVRVEWNATGFGGNGTVTFELEPAEVDLPDAPPPPAASTPESAPPPAPAAGLVEAYVRAPVDRTAASGLTAPLPRIVVIVAFEAAWDGGCEDAHGAFSARADNRTLAAAPPPGFFASLCLLSSLPDPT